MKPSRTSKASVCASLLTLVSMMTLTGIARGQTAQPTGLDCRDLLSPITSTGSDAATSEKERIGTMIREYLLKNPSIIREAMQALEAQEEEDRQKAAATNLEGLKSAIYSDPDSPTAGNDKGDVSIVVFFDYNCGYCRNTLPRLQSISAKDPLVRIIYKEFPVLGPQSTYAAKAALSAARQGKYVEFHNALMTAESTGEDSIKSISKTLGLDYTKLQKDMADPQIDEQLARIQRLAGSLDINGTPAYIIGDQIIPGAIDAESLTRFVTIERKNSKDAIAAKSVVSNQ